MHTTSSPDSKPAANTFSSLEQLQAHFQGEIHKTLLLLNSSLDAAFADKNRDHPSQLVYRALWNEMKVIFFPHGDQVKPEGMSILKKRFQMIRENLAELTGVYFIDHKQEIATNTGLMKKMGITDIQTYQFNPVGFYQSLSANKQRLFTTLVDLFELIATLSRMLEYKPYQDICTSTQALETALLKRHDQLIDHIGDVIRAEFTSSSKCFLGPDAKPKPSSMDLLMEAAQNKVTLREEIKAGLQHRKDEITKIISFDLPRFEKEAQQIEDEFALKKRIDDYLLLYARVEADINNHKLDRPQFAEIIRTLYLQRNALLHDMNHMDELKKRRDDFVKKLAKERHECSGRHYQVEPVGDEVLQSVSVVNEFKRKNAIIHGHTERHEYLPGKDDISSLTLFDTLQELDDVSSELRERNLKQVDILHQELEKLMSSYAYDCIVIVDILSKKLDSLCDDSKDQSLFNKLWHDDVTGAIDPMFAVMNQVEDIFAKTDFINQLTLHEYDQSKEHIAEYLAANAKAHQEIMNSQRKNILDVQQDLDKSETAFRRVLLQIQAVEFDKAIAEAKRDYKNQLEKIHNRMSACNSGVLQTNLHAVQVPDFACLKALFDKQHPQTMFMQPEVNWDVPSGVPGDAENKQAQMKKEITAVSEQGFFKRHWKAIVATTSVFAVGGAGFGLGMGLGSAIPTFGLGAAFTPVLAVTGFFLGALTGFIAGCLGSLAADAWHKKHLVVKSEGKSADKSHSSQLTYGLVNKVLKEAQPVRQFSNAGSNDVPLQIVTPISRNAAWVERNDNQDSYNAVPFKL